MNVNSFRITDANGDEIGISFDPLLGMANHSCAPNASLEFNGRCAVLTALRHIEEGEEITISYIGQQFPTSLSFLLADQSPILCKTEPNNPHRHNPAPRRPTSIPPRALLFHLRLPRLHHFFHPTRRYQTR